MDKVTFMVGLMFRVLGRLVIRISSRIRIRFMVNVMTMLRSTARLYLMLELGPWLGLVVIL